MRLIVIESTGYEATIASIASFVAIERLLLGKLSDWSRLIHRDMVSGLNSTYYTESPIGMALPLVFNWCYSASWNPVNTSTPVRYITDNRTTLLITCIIRYYRSKEHWLLKGSPIWELVVAMNAGGLISIEFLNLFISLSKNRESLLVLFNGSVRLSVLSDEINELIIHLSHACTCTTSYEQCKCERFHFK